MADSSAPVAGRRQAGSAGAGDVAPASSVGQSGPAGRPRAADGSEVSGGRADVPSGWGDGAADGSASGWGGGIGRRPALALGDSTGAVRISGDADDVDAGAAGGRQRGKFNEGQAAEATIVQEGTIDEATSPGGAAAAAAAAAPRNVAGRKVQTMQELAAASGAGGLRAGAGGSSMLASAAASSSSASSGSRAPALAGVDLSLLTAAIAPPDALAEPDEVWQFDRILQQLTQASCCSHFFSFQCRYSSAMRLLSNALAPLSLLLPSHLFKCTLRHCLQLPLPPVQEMVAEQERQEAEAAGAGPLSPKGA